MNEEKSLYDKLFDVLVKNDKESFLKIVTEIVKDLPEEAGNYTEEQERLWKYYKTKYDKVNIVHYNHLISSRDEVYSKVIDYIKDNPQDYKTANVNEDMITKYGLEFFDERHTLIETHIKIKEIYDILSQKEISHETLSIFKYMVGLGRERYKDGLIIENEYEEEGPYWIDDAPGFKQFKRNMLETRYPWLI